MYSKKINQLATNLNPQSSDLIPIGDATTGQLKTVSYATVFGIPEDGIISGGVVTWSGTGLLFNVSACTYSINGVRYTTSATTVTLTAADPTNPRIDVIAVNTSGAVVLITGTASSNPVEPQVDPSTQIQLTNITVNAGATTPNISSELIYEENVETWTKTDQFFTSINYASTVNPYIGSKCILATAPSGSLPKIRFVAPSPIIDYKNYSVFKFAIKLQRPLVTNEIIAVHILAASGYGGNYIYLNGPDYPVGSYGFDYSSTSWQLIQINLPSVFNGFPELYGVDFYAYKINSSLTFNLDRIELQSSNNQLPTSGISIGDKVNNATTGSVLFAGANNSLQQDNTNFYWDDTNNRLGLGNNTPAFTLDVSGTGRFTGNLTASSFIKSGGTASQILAANGTVITAGTNITISGGTISANDTDTGITSLNGLTALSQTFATGTSGTDFNISSATSTHTFNLPTASATNRGLLSSTDWTTFNNKQNALTNPVTGTGTTNEIAYWTSSSAIGSLTTATYPSLTELSYVKGVTSAIQTQINAKFTLPSLTNGSVLFSNGTTIAQDNANFFWDDTNNRLGIGTNSPAYTIDINGTGRFSDNLLVSKNQNAATSLTISNTTSGTGSASGIYITSNSTSGTAFIGKLSTLYTTFKFVTVNDLLIYNSDTAGGDISILNDRASGAIKFAAGGSSTAQMTLTAEGRLGIGTTTFTYAQANRGYVALNGTTDSIFEFKNNNSVAGYLFANSNYFEILSAGTRYMNFTTNSTERMRITSSGKVLINTTTDSGDQLMVVGAISAIGTTIGGALLSRSSTAAYGWGNAFSGAGHLTLTNSGVANVGYFTMATGVYTATSDINKKKDIEVSTLGLNEILQLIPKTYRFKTQSNEEKKSIGFIAQDVKDVIPYAYQESKSEDETFIGLQYDSFIPVLVKAIQEQQAQIEELKLEVKTFKKQ